MVKIIHPTYEEYKEMIESSTTIAINIFGFLLALLGLILQGSSQTIQKMMSKKKLYEKFINFNKLVVICALTIAIFGFLLKFNDNYFYIESFKIIDEILISLFISMFSFLIFQSIYFIILFYKLLKN